MEGSIVSRVCGLGDVWSYVLVVVGYVRFVIHHSWPLM